MAEHAGWNSVSGLLRSGPRGFGREWEDLALQMVFDEMLMAILFQPVRVCDHVTRIEEPVHSGPPHTHCGLGIGRYLLLGLVRFDERRHGE
jgi:hypothetical protein